MRGFEDYFQHNIFHVYYNPLKLISKKRSFVSTTIYFLLEMYSILGTTAEEIKKKKKKNSTHIRYHIATALHRVNPWKLFQLNEGIDSRLSHARSVALPICKETVLCMNI